MDEKENEYGIAPEPLDGIPRPLYRDLHIIWWMLCVAAVAGLFNGLPAAAVALVCGVVRLYRQYLLREVSDGLDRAFRTQMLALALTLGGTVLGLLAAGSVLGILLMLVALAGAVISFAAEYYFYAALDELVAVRGYDYPAGRIRWAFWLALVFGIASAALLQTQADSLAGSVVGVIGNAAVLAVLAQYLQAVKKQEQAFD